MIDYIDCPVVRGHNLIYIIKDVDLDLKTNFVSPTFRILLLPDPNTVVHVPAPYPIPRDPISPANDPFSTCRHGHTLTSLHRSSQDHCVRQMTTALDQITPYTLTHTHSLIPLTSSLLPMLLICFSSINSSEMHTKLHTH